MHKRSNFYEQETQSRIRNTGLQLILKKWEYLTNENKNLKDLKVEDDIKSKGSGAFKYLTFSMSKGGCSDNKFWRCKVKKSKNLGLKTVQDNWQKYYVIDMFKLQTIFYSLMRLNLSLLVIGLGKIKISTSPTKHHQKLNVWTRIVGNRIFGCFFFHWEPSDFKYY